ncbi:MAG: hypothetical protein LBT15_03940, partial [Synergistaceae bacterium]|nr:hypothetical protein [Synergistaceae bacterium]
YVGTHLTTTQFPYYTLKYAQGTFTRGRNDIGLNHSLEYGGPYGMTFGGGGRSVYNPKLMQTWHFYYPAFARGPNEKPATVATADVSNTQDNRRGFRWDLDRDDSQWKIVPTGWRTRHLIKLTVLEITKDIHASQVEADWRARIHHDGSTDMTWDPGDVIHRAGDMFVRMEMIQLRKMNPVDPDHVGDSRTYVYSKPIWFGKFRGDAWRSDSPSPFKKMGNRMMHLVSDPEPKGGDLRSYRGRGMRTRSWRDNFRGWDFNSPQFDKTYRWEKDLVRNLIYNDSELQKKIDPTPFHPDMGDPGMNDDQRVGDDSVWIPPVAIDMKGFGVHGTWSERNDAFLQDILQSPDHGLFGYRSISAGGRTVGSLYTAVRPSMYTENGVNIGFSRDAATGSEVHAVYQYGDRRGDTFGNYAFRGEKVEFERRLKDPQKPALGYAYGYNGRYTPMIYGRLSMQRPWDNATLRKTPIYGLYALRGWDLTRYERWGTGLRGDESNPVYDFNATTQSWAEPAVNVQANDQGYMTKRFLMVVQGLQMPYHPHRIKDLPALLPDTEIALAAPRRKAVFDADPKEVVPSGSVYRRAPLGGSYENYRPDRERTIGFRFWAGDASGADTTKHNDTWITGPANPNQFRIHDMWLEEGFSPKEVREILGLDPAQFPDATLDRTIPGLYESK